jgi:hypothetical protein
MLRASTPVAAIILSSFAYSWSCVLPSDPAPHRSLRHRRTLTLRQMYRFTTDPRSHPPSPERLVYQRNIQPRAYALAMIRQVRLGRPPLGDYDSTLALDDYLWRESYPKRGTAGLTDRMLTHLTTHGLDALTAEPPAVAGDSNVIPLRRPAR